MSVLVLILPCYPFPSLLSSISPLLFLLFFLLLIPTTAPLLSFPPFSISFFFPLSLFTLPPSPSLLPLSPFSFIHSPPFSSFPIFLLPPSPVLPYQIIINSTNQCNDCLFGFATVLCCLRCCLGMQGIVARPAC